MNPVVKWIFYIALFITFLAFSYLLISLIYANKKRINQLLNTDETQAEINRFKSYYKYKEKKELKVIRFIHTLIIRANIRSSLVHPWLFVLISAVIFLVGAAFISLFLIPLQAIIIAAFLSTIPEVVLFLLSEKIGTSTDKSFIAFLDMLKNFLGVKDDINFAMTMCAHYYTQLSAIAQYCQDYVFDVSHGITTIKALENFSNKIDNTQIKLLMESLITANKSSGRYHDVVSKFEENYKDLCDKLLERKKKAKELRTNYAVITFVVVLILLCVSSINGNMIQLLFHTKMGLIISTYAMLSFIIPFYVVLYIGHFKFE